MWLRSPAPTPMANPSTARPGLARCAWSKRDAWCSRAPAKKLWRTTGCGVSMPSPSQTEFGSLERAPPTPKRARCLSQSLQCLTRQQAAPSIEWSCDMARIEVIMKMEGARELRRALRKQKERFMAEMAQALPEEGQALMNLANAAAPTR